MGKHRQKHVRIYQSFVAEESNSCSASESFECGVDRCGGGYRVRGSRRRSGGGCFDDCGPCGPPCGPGFCGPCGPNFCGPCGPNFCGPCGPNACGPNFCGPCGPNACGPCGPNPCDPCGPNACGPCDDFCSDLYDDPWFNDEYSRCNKTPVNGPTLCNGPVQGSSSVKDNTLDQNTSCDKKKKCHRKKKGHCDDRKSCRPCGPCAPCGPCEPWRSVACPIATVGCWDNNDRPDAPYCFPYFNDTMNGPVPFMGPAAMAYQFNQARTYAL